MRAIFFSRPNCPPCEKVLPGVQAEAKRWNIPLEVINVFEQPETANRYGIKSTPHLIVFDDNNVIQYSSSSISTGLFTYGDD